MTYRPLITDDTPEADAMYRQGASIASREESLRIFGLCLVLSVGLIIGAVLAGLARSWGWL